VSVTKIHEEKKLEKIMKLEQKRLHSTIFRSVKNRTSD